MPAYQATTISILELPDFSKIRDGVPWCIDTMSLAHHLGIRNRTLMGMIVRRGKLYKSFAIPKKTGGFRSIHAPEPKLKFVQNRVLKRFLTHLEYPDHIAAYVPDRTTRYSAERHSKKQVLLVIDLKDFFPSTRRAWVRKMFREEFGLPFEVASALADITTVPIDGPKGKRYVVPQGAPTSGAVCNWVANHRIDRAILEECAKWGMDYTRYADDLAFSSNQTVERSQVNRFIRIITKIIKAAGYAINRKKLRVTRPGRQQRLLGMTVNEKPNVIRAQYRALRARIHHVMYKGLDAVAKEMGVASGALLKSQIEGKISYYHMVNPEKAQRLRDQLDQALEHQNALLHAVPNDPVVAKAQPQ